MNPIVTIVATDWPNNEACFLALCRHSSFPIIPSDTLKFHYNHRLLRASIPSISDSVRLGAPASRTALRR
ncbi:hypothetical protein KL86PLE_130279 [uncultured Pleomorphomonas sp.]|uniref:Uncharacterized protein n=1 Tax=uncultured Pleomorphomonas sp. TaxID=442121 RepID=A0A212LB83_9HYPH|nr:hypothetical protein KL86PLE_130279 [uncultured Pleomorphomonas sp.]